VSVSYGTSAFQIQKSVESLFRQKQLFLFVSQCLLFIDYMNAQKDIKEGVCSIILIIFQIAFVEPHFHFLIKEMGKKP